MNDDGNLSDIFKCYFYDVNKFYSPRAFLPKAEAKESVDPQIHYWAHMLDEAFCKDRMLTEGKHWPKDYIKTGINLVKAS